MGNFFSSGHTEQPEPEEEAMEGQDEDVEDVIPEERVPSTHRMRLRCTPWDPRQYDSPPSGFAYFMYDTDDDDDDDESRSGAASVDEQVASLSTSSTEVSDTEVPVESVQVRYKDSAASSCVTDSSGVTASDEDVVLVRGGPGCFAPGRAVPNTQVKTLFAAVTAPEHVATLSSTISPPVKVAPVASPEPRASSTTTMSSSSASGDSKMVSRLDGRARMRRMARQHETQQLRSREEERVRVGSRRNAAVQTMRTAGGHGSTGGKASRRKKRKASSLKFAPKPAPVAPALKTTASVATRDGTNSPVLTGSKSSKVPPSSPLKRSSDDHDTQGAAVVPPSSRRVRSKKQASASRPRHGGLKVDSDSSLNEASVDKVDKGKKPELNATIEQVTSSKSEQAEKRSAAAGKPTAQAANGDTASTSSGKGTALAGLSKLSRSRSQAMRKFPVQLPLPGQLLSHVLVAIEGGASDRTAVQQGGATHAARAAAGVDDRIKVENWLRMMNPLRYRLLKECTIMDLTSKVRQATFWCEGFSSTFPTHDSFWQAVAEIDGNYDHSQTGLFFTAVTAACRDLQSILYWLQSLLGLYADSYWDRLPLSVLSRRFDTGSTRNRASAGLAPRESSRTSKQSATKGSLGHVKAEPGRNVSENDGSSVGEQPLFVPSFVFSSVLIKTLQDDQALDLCGMCNTQEECQDNMSPEPCRLLLIAAYCRMPIGGLNIWHVDKDETTLYLKKLQRERDEFMTTALQPGAATINDADVEAYMTLVGPPKPEAIDLCD